jgi:pimeloyl-ACP methyl ester carboxylesterase
VLLHGAIESAQSHMQLAEALADTFTLYLPDRRGRGLSGPARWDDSLDTNVVDMEAVLWQTGAHHVFGVSSGAIIWLQAALTLPAIHRAAIFEPPLVVDGSAPTDFVARYDEEIAQGRVAAALVTGMKGAQMGPAIFKALREFFLA